VQNIALTTVRYLVNIPEPVQYKIYALALPYDLRCESGAYNSYNMATKDMTEKYAHYSSGTVCPWELCRYSVISLITVLSYSTVVIYIRIKKVWDFSPKITSTNLPNIYFLTAWQNWIGIAKPKNAFKSTLTPCNILLWNSKNFLLNRFFCWLTDYLTIWLTDAFRQDVTW